MILKSEEKCRMKVAYLLNTHPMTSTTFIRREIHALERQGFQVIRIALRGWDSTVVDDEDIIERERTRYVLGAGLFALLLAPARMLITRPRLFLRALTLMWRLGWRGDRPLHIHFAYLAEACRIEPWLRVAGVQHLHAHFGTNSAEVAMLVHELGGPSWSFTVHGPEEFDKPISINLGDKIRRCAFVVAVSSYTRSQLYRWVEHQYWSKVHLVHCGLEPAYFAEPIRAISAAPRLVCVGRLCEQKGQLLLVEAAHLLMLQGVDFDLVFAGDGEMRGGIERLISSHKLEGKIRITGWIANEQVREEILAARALVLPSFAEGLPIVIMEAMALRRPVITTLVAGIPELVHSGEHGWLVPAGDVKALADVMRICLEAPVDVLNRMGEAAYSRVLSRHRSETHALSLAKLFDAALAETL
jgi:colanic acid/amylovoran biosynthesis glycosyltransferase